MCKAFLCFVIIGFSEGIKTRVTYAKEYKAKGYIRAEYLGGNLGLPQYWEGHFVRLAMGYGPILIGSEVIEVSHLPEGKPGDCILSFFPLHLYFVPYRKIYEKKDEKKVDYFVSSAWYLYGEGSMWGNLYPLKEQVSFYSESPSAKYFKTGIGYSSFSHWLIPEYIDMPFEAIYIDLRVGYSVGCIDAGIVMGVGSHRAFYSGASTNTIYASVALSIGFWYAHGVDWASRKEEALIAKADNIRMREEERQKAETMARALG